MEGLCLSSLSLSINRLSRLTILLIGLATYYDSDHEDGDDIVSPSKKLNVS
jgi:hypothetical protein